MSPFESEFDFDSSDCGFSIGGELFSGMDIVIMSEIIRLPYGVCQATEAI